MEQVGSARPPLQEAGLEEGAFLAARAPASRWTWLQEAAGEAPETHGEPRKFGGGLSAISLKREGPSATLLSEGTQRQTTRHPLTKLRAATSRRTAFKRGLFERPFPAASMRLMLSPRNRSLCPKHSVDRRRCLTAQKGRLASERVICSEPWMRPTKEHLQEGCSRKLRGTSVKA